MKRVCLSLIASFLILARLLAASTTNMHYEVSVDVEGKYLEVSLDYTGEGFSDDSPLVLNLPVWAPGYYCILDYAKNLTGFKVTDSAGNPVRWQKKGKSSWEIFPSADRLKVSYRVFANARSVAECRVEDTMAFIPGNGVFMYPSNEVNTPVDVTYVMPQGWKRVVTGMNRVVFDNGLSFTAQYNGDNNKYQTFHADNFDVLYDSPALAGNFHYETFRFGGQMYELAFEEPKGIVETNFRDDIKKIISASTDMFGDVPYDKYCFILLGHGQGGLEHSNSQACYISGNSFLSNEHEYRKFMNFITHEYFHLYNVKNIRPVELGPFDYQKEVFTPMLWVAEGFTVYYEGVIMRRAGLSDGDDFLDFLSEYVKTVESENGHRVMSLRESSYDIWLNFFNTNSNGKDVRISYYDKGPILAFLMDIEIRRLTDNAKSLDDVMRLLYSRYSQQLKRGYTEEEFWCVCKEIAGSELTLMRKYVDTTCEIDYDTCLAPAGLALDRENWKITRLQGLSKQQKKINTGLFGEK